MSSKESLPRRVLRALWFAGYSHHPPTALDELGRGASMHYTEDPRSRAAIEFGVFGIPETILIRDGVIVGKLIGETDALTLSTTIEQIMAGESVGARQVGEYQQQPSSNALASWPLASDPKTVLYLG